MKRTVSSLVLVLSCLFSVAPAGQQAEYFGKLDPELTPSRSSVPSPYKAASEEDRAKLPAKLSEGEQAFAGRLFWKGTPKDAALVILVEPAKGEPYIYADLDNDGALADKERFSFTPFENKDADIAGEVLLKFPLKNDLYKHYPVLVRRFKAGKGPQKEGMRMLLHSSWPFARGSVEIQGRKTLVRYSFDPVTQTVDPTKGYSGIDGDGNGEIDTGFTSPEFAYAKNESVVFRVDQHYVSVKSVDARTGEIVLRSHPASDYQRIELRAGAEIPDFGFVDFDGKARKLSEFRGKYVLLDFWGTWCGPCVGEIPHLKEAYAKYRSRGFEILGMDEDRDLAKVKAFVAEKGITWTQATTESIKELMEKRFRITAFPTTVLLDPQGKVVSLGGKNEMGLRGPRLMETLEKVLAAKQ